jgi:hypothetical protein
MTVTITENLITSQPKKLLGKKDVLFFLVPDSIPPQTLRQTKSPLRLSLKEFA